MKSRLRITQYTITPHSIFDENAVRVEIEDVGGGEFLRLNLNNDHSVDVEPADWPLVRDACNRLVADIRRVEKTVATQARK